MKKWLADSLECCCYLRNVRDLQMGKHLMKDDSENHLKVQLFRLVPWLNIIRCLQRRPVKAPPIWYHSLPGIFLGYVVIAGGIWKGDMLVADTELLEDLDA